MLGRFESVWRQAGHGGTELVVDLANVCRDSTLDQLPDPARWDRLDRLAEAWARWPSAFDMPRVQLIADASLRHDLAPADRRLLKDAESDGWVEVYDYADDPILDAAEQHGCLVLSRDQFVGHRRPRPWLDDNDQQFVSWSAASGEVTLERRSLDVRTGYSLSRAEEQDELKALHLDPKRARDSQLLADVHRCENVRCLRRAFGAPDAEVPPVAGTGGQAVCQSCNEPLVRVGRRADTAILKLSAVDGHAEPDRLPLPSGASVVVGRASADLSLKGLLDDGRRRRISREHVRVTFDGLQVQVVELGSSNGTTIEAWDTKAKSHLGPAPLSKAVTVRLAPRDRLTMAGVLRLERSGRRYPFDLAPPSPGSGNAAPGTAY